MKNPRKSSKFTSSYILNSTNHKHFNEFYTKFSKPLFKFIAKRVHKKETIVEEILEESFVSAWKGWDTFEHRSSYFTWLCKISLNKISDYYRDQVNGNSKFIVPLIDSLNAIDTNTLSPDERLALKELKFSVNDCLNLLPYKKRRLLWFRYWMDYSYAKIGKILGVSPRAVEGKLYRAKHDFAREWSKNFK